MNNVRKAYLEAMDQSHILLIYEEPVPSGVLKQFCNDVYAKGLDLRQIKAPARGPQAGLEWYIPTLVVIFILKSYFDAFLKEAGKDHYLILKESLKGFWKQFFSAGRSLRVGMLDSKREVRHPKYSLLFSIYAVIDNKRKVKFLISNDCSEEEYAEGINEFLDFLSRYHRNAKQMELNSDEGKWYGMLFVEYDKETKSLRILDPLSARINADEGS